VVVKTVETRARQRNLVFYSTAPAFIGLVQLDVQHRRQLLDLALLLLQLAERVEQITRVRVC